MTRGRDLPTDIPSEIQRMMIRDMHDYRITKVNPFDPPTTRLLDFISPERSMRNTATMFSWQTLKTWQGVLGLIWKKEETDNAKRVARASKKKREAGEETKTKKSKKGGADTKLLHDLMQELVFEPTTKLTDTIVEAYPCNDRVLVLVELLRDGNAEDANAFDFAPSGDKLIHWTRTPSANNTLQELCNSH